MKSGIGELTKTAQGHRRGRKPNELANGASEFAVGRSIEIYVDGGGANGYGVAGCAWIRPGIAIHVERGSGWTCNEAEYRGLISALRYLPFGSCATVFSDSQLMVRQVAGEYATDEPRLQSLLERARQIMSRRNLSVQLNWIPREQNLADALLRLNVPGMNRRMSKGYRFTAVSAG